MTVFGENKKKRIGKQLLMVGILLFTMVIAGTSWGQSTPVSEDLSSSSSIGKLKKNNNWQVVLGDQKYPVPSNVLVYGCNREETQLLSYMEGAQANVIFKEIETPDGETVKKVHKLYLICK